jgi:hypothetical protein
VSFWRWKSNASLIDQCLPRRTRRRAFPPVAFYLKRLLSSAPQGGRAKAPVFPGHCTHFRLSARLRTAKVRPVQPGREEIGRPVHQASTSSLPDVPTFVLSLLAGRPPTSPSSSASSRPCVVQAGPDPVLEAPAREKHAGNSASLHAPRPLPVRRSGPGSRFGPRNRSIGESPPIPDFSNTQNAKFQRFQARNGKLKRRHQGPHSACIDRHARPWSFTL